MYAHFKIEKTNFFDEKCRIFSNIDALAVSM